MAYHMALAMRRLFVARENPKYVLFLQSRPRAVATRYIPIRGHFHITPAHRQARSYNIYIVIERK